MASADDVRAPAAPPGDLAQRTTAWGRWLLPLALPLILAQVSLLMYDSDWGRNRLSMAAEAAVALACLALLLATLHRHRLWRPALASLPLTALLTWAAWIVAYRGSSMSMHEAIVFLPSPPVGLGLMGAAVMRGEARLVVAATVAWFPIPLVLLLT